MKLKNEIITSIKHSKALLLDFDGTLTDYHENEDIALRKLFNQSKLPKEDYKKAINEYKLINESYWGLFEKKIISLEEVQYNRFRDFKAKYPVFDDKPTQLNAQFLSLFIKTTVIDPKVKQALIKIKELGILLIIITNGIHDTQTTRFKYLGLDTIIDTYFTSESVGFPKPNPEMFHKSIAFIKKKLGNKNIEPKDIWVVGDSFKADIEGAQPLGYQTCWISNGNKVESKKEPTLIVKNITEFLDLYLEIKSSL